MPKTNNTDASHPIEDALKAFSAAWAARDVEAVAMLFAEDGVYSSSIGPEPGRRAVGHAQIRNLVGDMFKADDGSVAETSDPVVLGHAAFWTWRYTFPDGSVEVGCDYLELREGKITLKDAYRKIHRDI